HASLLFKVRSFGERKRIEWRAVNDMYSDPAVQQFVVFQIELVYNPLVQTRSFIVTKIFPCFLHLRRTRLSPLLVSLEAPKIREARCLASANGAREIVEVLKMNADLLSLSSQISFWHCQQAAKRGYPIVSKEESD